MVSVALWEGDFQVILTGSQGELNNSNEILGTAGRTSTITG